MSAVARVVVATRRAVPAAVRCFSSQTIDPRKIAAPINVHRSNAQELIAKVPVVEVDADVAMCDGGGGTTGHPIEYIMLNKRGGDLPATCKYCGIQYKRKPHHH